MSQPKRGGRVLIIDDHPLTREGLSLAVRHALQGCVIDTAGRISEALDILRNRLAYRLILLDYILPDTTGFSGLLQIQYATEDTSIALISSREDIALVDTARSLGASGFLYKRYPLDVLAKALRNIDAGYLSFPEPEAAVSNPNVRSGDGLTGLSTAQRRVLQALTSGLSNLEIAADLELSESTVKTHLTAIYHKLGALNRTQAILAAKMLQRRQLTGRTYDERR